MLFYPLHSFTSTTMDSILPSCVSVCEYPRQAPERRNHAEEERIVAASCMSLSRLKEFQLGRSCAHQALDRLGKSDRPLGTDAHRAPLWPEGMVGSITHCIGYCAAAAARRSDLLSLGINAERWRDFSSVRAAEIAYPWETSQPGLEGFAPGTALGLILSAKKSLYKALHTLIEAPFDFRDVELSFDIESASFAICRTALASVEDYQDILFGRFVFDETILLTSAVVSRWTLPGSR